MNVAQQTPEGRARIALAFTIGSGRPGGAPPHSQPGLEDTAALQHSMYHTLFPMPTTLEAKPGSGKSTAPSGQQLSWNTGVDYREFYIQRQRLPHARGSAVVSGGGSGSRRRPWTDQRLSPSLRVPLRARVVEHAWPDSQRHSEDSTPSDARDRRSTGAAQPGAGLWRFGSRKRQGRPVSPRRGELTGTLQLHRWGNAWPRSRH